MRTAGQEHRKPGTYVTGSSTRFECLHLVAVFRVKGPSNLTTGVSHGARGCHMLSGVEGSRQGFLLRGQPNAGRST